MALLLASVIFFTEFCSDYLERGRLAGPRPQPKQKHVITDLLYRSVNSKMRTL